MERQEHLERTGGEGEEIHRFLDGFWYAYGADHRVVFHHQKGVEFAVKIFGEDKRWIIEDHVRADWYGKIPAGPDDSNFYRPAWAVNPGKFSRAVGVSKRLCQ